MDAMVDMFYGVKRKMLTKYPRFGSEIANTQIILDNSVQTGATDGKNIYINPEHFASIDDNHRLYLIAHETAHKMFRHMYRLKDKNGNMRDMDLWNIVCDAVVNANLKRDGINIPDGRICSNTDEEFGEWVLEYNCEELYELKKREKEEEQSKQNQGQENGDGENQGQNNQQGNSQNQEPNNQQENGQNQGQNNKQENSDKDTTGGDDHSLWQEAFQEQQNSKKKSKKQNKNSQKQEQKQGEQQEQEQEEEQEEQTGEEETDIDFDEKKEFEDNREQKRQKFNNRRERTEKEMRGQDGEKINIGDVGKSKEEIDWKILVRRKIDKAETIWSQRHSIAENNWAYRLEENEIEDDAQTEVMIDVSGSVDLDLVRAFLRQLKPLLKQSKLRVGCFNEKFWGFVEIKNEKDIDNFTIPEESRGHYAWTEDWDLAVRSFTKKREINKFVFTDGYPCPGTMPKEDLKREQVTWLVYGNKEFKPCCGDVIHITKKYLEKLHKNTEYSKKDMSR